MSDTLRSNGGCWTCRTRRKKCDETHPICLTCTSLRIPCVGYGSKPTWMDRGPKEREVAKSLRDAVRRTLSLQRQGPPQQSNSASRISLGELEALNRLHGSSIHNFPFDRPLSDVNLMQKGSLSPTNESYTALSPPPAVLSTSSYSVSRDLILTKESWSVLPEQFDKDQASLLMHFFDHVLPLQFRFYNPSVHEGGRGWLLSILTRTTPLYSVALSLAAYHQQSILVRGSGIPCTASLEKLQERHIECIKLLRSHLETIPGCSHAKGCEKQIEIMACIVMLIALELFRGDTNDWQTHLKAASTMSLCFDSTQLEEGTSYPAHKLAVEFLTGVITWYDILSCASTGLRPISNSANVNDDDFSRIKFDKIMGCENWAMRLIMEIATLNDWKVQTEESGSSSTSELGQRASNIKKRLECGLVTTVVNQGGNEAINDMTTMVYSNNSTSLIHGITQVFASAALVYLQVIISGPNPEVPEIREGVSRTMVALDALADKSLVRNLLWPVCIAGCMATVEYESYWRDLISHVSQEKWSFGYPSKVLEVIEECWRVRKYELGMSVDWLSAMKRLDIRILLV